ncbi:MAG: NAD(P)/FAD-dependent oxidoreductase [Brevinematia bacterium]
MYKVVVLGGGFAGVTFSKNLLKLSKNSNNIKVHLVDVNEYQCLLPSVPSLISNKNQKILLYYSDIFRKFKNFEFTKAKVENISFEEKIIYLDNGNTINYDQLILSLGVQPYDLGIENVKENAIMFWDEKDLNKYVQKLNYFISKGISPRILIIGAGPIGVEIASETYHFLNKNKMGANILIIEAKERCLPTLDEKLSKSVEKYILNKGIKILYNSYVCGVEKDYVYCQDGKKYEYDILIWSVGVTANPILKKIESNSEFKFEKGQQGRIIVDEYLRVKNIQDVWAIGDIALPQNQKVFPMALAQFAIQMAEVCSTNVLNHILGKDLKKLNLSFKGIVIQLSKSHAAALLEKPFKIIIPPSYLGLMLRKLIDLNYIISVGAKPRKYPLQTLES